MAVTCCKANGRVMPEWVWQGVTQIQSNFNFSSSLKKGLIWFPGTLWMWGLLCFELPEQGGMLFLCLKAEHTHFLHTIAAGTLLTQWRGSSWKWEIQFRKLSASSYGSFMIFFACFSTTLFSQSGITYPTQFSFLPQMKWLDSAEMGRHQL